MILWVLNQWPFKLSLFASQKSEFGCILEWPVKVRIINIFRRALNKSQIVLFNTFSVNLNIFQTASFNTFSVNISIFFKFQDQRHVASLSSPQTQPWLPHTSGSGLASSTSVTTDISWSDPLREVAYRPDSTRNSHQFVDVSKVFNIPMGSR